MKRKRQKLIHVDDKDDYNPLPEDLGDIVLACKDRITKNEFLIMFYYIGPHVYTEQNWAIYNACYFGCINIVKFLLAHPKVNPTETNCAILKWAVRYNHYEIVRLILLDGRVRPSTSDIVTASRNSNLKIIQLLMDDPRVDPSVNNNQAFRDAIENQDYEVVKLLMTDLRVDPSVNRDDAFRKVLKTDDHYFVRLLLSDERVRFDPKLWHHVESVEILCELLAHSKCKPLHSILAKSIRNGRYKMVKIILNDKRVSPAYHGHEPDLEFAQEHGYYRIVQCMLNDPRVTYKLKEK